ncbi:MAG: hypothetical protein MZW92_14090 [Comamonadaceae bacterium]|nr:hypothetical protein [Comamonadaceae bacterium]
MRNVGSALRHPLDAGRRGPREEARQGLRRGAQEDAGPRHPSRRARDPGEPRDARPARIEGPFMQALGMSTSFRSEDAAKVLMQELDPIVQKSLADLDKLIEIQRNRPIARRSTRPSPAATVWP